MAKILLLSTNFSSAVSTNGQIARTFFGELCRRGHDVTVITSDRYGAEKETEFAHVHVIHTPLWFRPIEYIFKFFSRDVTRLWEVDQFCYRVGARFLIKKLLRQEKFDAVHSISIGYSTHMLASWMKAETGLPWIAQFYDPWHDNFYRLFRFACIKRLDSAHEEDVAQRADFIIHSNQTVCDLWAERYGDAVKKKFVLIPFNLGSVPPYEPRHLKKEAGDKLTVVHIGNLYQGRDSFPFIYAVEKLCALRPELRARLAVQYVGRVSQAEKDYLCQRNLTDVFTLIGSLPEAECNPYFLHADIFLAIDAEQPARSAFFPSKLIKYFYFRKPILGITPIGSPSYYAYQEGGYTSYTHKDTDGIVNFLLRAMENDESLVSFNHDYWEKYTNENLSRIYQQEIVPFLSPKDLGNA